MKQLDKSPERYDICKHIQTYVNINKNVCIIDLDIHFICHLVLSLYTTFKTFSRNWRS